MSSLTCQIAGVDPINPKQPCLGTDSKSGKIGFLPSPQNGGAIGFMGTMISTLYTPPLHTADYFQNLASNFGITKKTYAQTTGTGFQSLTPLIGIWSAFRNIVYLLLVIVFVVIGLAIMLRMKIDPRTVMTIQNQIPKIIIGILMVTFSYAIGGFLIDMMYVSIHVAGNAIVTSDPKIHKKLPTQLSKETNPFGAVGKTGAGGGNTFFGLWDIIQPPSSALGEAIIRTFDPVINLFTGRYFTDLFVNLFTDSTSLVGKIISWAINSTGHTISAILHWTLGTIFTILAFVIISIALLIALFRLWFSLVFAYVNILLGIVLAPFWIIGGLFPGSPINFSSWIRNLIANLAAFPTVIAMFLLGKVFTDAFGVGDGASYFLPPLIGDRTSTQAIGSIIGLGIILMTPNVVNMLKAALKAPKTDTGIGKAIGGAVGIPISTGKNIGSTIMGSREYIAGPKGFEKRTLGASFWGGLVGRR